jgi:hypothetical protein
MKRGLRGADYRDTDGGRAIMMESNSTAGPTISPECVYVNATQESARRAASPPDGRRTTARRLRVDRLLGLAVFSASFAIFLLQAPGLDYYLTSRDHGYQLCIGEQVLLGKTPGVDVITVYGPMAMYASALAMLASGSLVGETVQCAAGYAGCLTLLYLLVRPHWSRLAGLAAACVGYFLMARFYKWYVWLIPLATLWALQGWISAPPARKARRLLLCGAIVGASWMFRLDMGAFAAFACCLVILACEFREGRSRWIRSLAVFAAAAACFPAGWLAYLAITVGPGAAAGFLGSTIHGALEISRGMAAPMPARASVAFGYGISVATLTVAVLAGVLLARESDPRGTARLLLAAGLIGAATFHQAMHRRDPQHLLQVIPPVIVASFLAMALLRRTWLAPTAGRGARRAVGSLGLAYAAALAVAAFGVSTWGRQDLVSPRAEPIARYRELARPLDHGDRHPAIRAVRFVRENTAPGDSVLAFPLDCQLLALAERKLSGRLHGYYAGVFAGPADAAANLDAIRRDPPALVLTPSEASYASDPLAGRGREGHRDVDDYIRADYPRVVYDDGATAIRAR